MTTRNAKLFAGIVCIVASVMLVLQLWLILDDGPRAGRSVFGSVAFFLLFFTIWSNLLVAVTTATVMFGKKGSPGFFATPGVQAGVALYIMIVAIVYNTLLRGLVELNGLSSLVNEGLHVVVPLLYLLYWIFVAPKMIRRVMLLRWLIVPAIYLVYALVRGWYEGIYPYPFLNVRLYGVAHVAGYAAGIMVMFLAGGIFLLWLARKAHAKPQSENSNFTP